MAFRSLLAFAGYPRSNGAEITVWSHSNAATTWACAGQSGSFSFQSVGTDRGSLPPGGQAQALFVGRQIISGIVGDPLSEQVCTITQGSVVFTVKFRLAPTEWSNFCIDVTTCNFTPYISGGAFNAVPVLPRAARVHIDDLGYILNNAGAIDDTATGGTGHLSTNAPQTSLKAYDYVLGWLWYFGMLQDGGSASEFVTQLADGNWVTQPGNHEFHVNAGRNGFNVLGGGNGYSLTAGQKDGVFKAAYDIMFGAMRPAPSSLGVTLTDTLAEPWLLKLGPSVIVSPDSLTRCNTAGGAILGSSQITDLLAALDRNEPFKFFASMRGARDNPGTGLSSINERPLMSDVLAEYNQLAVDTSPGKSFMANPKLNGSKGNLVWIRGDWHGGHVQYFLAPANTGIHAENFFCFACGSSNYSGYHYDGAAFSPLGNTSPKVYDIVEGQTYNNVRYDYMARANFNTDGSGNFETAIYDVRGGEPHCTRINIFGAEVPKRAVVEQLRNLDPYDLTWTKYGVVFSRQFSQWWTNNLGEVTGTVHKLTAKIYD